MTLVVDCSVALKWVLEEPDSARARDLVGEERLIAPDLILIECANALSMMAARSVIDAADAIARLTAIRNARMNFVPTEPLTEAAQRLSLQLRHPVYDCLYLALALERGARVITADKRFLAAAQPHHPGAMLLL